MVADAGDARWLLGELEKEVMVDELGCAVNARTEEEAVDIVEYERVD